MSGVRFREFKKKNFSNEQTRIFTKDGQENVSQTTQRNFPLEGETHSTFQRQIGCREIPLDVRNKLPISKQARLGQKKPQMAEETADLDRCGWIIADNSRQSVASVIIRGFFRPNVVRYDLEFADIFASSNAYFIYPIEKLRIHRFVVRLFERLPA
jgi:hypothetical protein